MPLIDASFVPREAEGTANDAVAISLQRRKGGGGRSGGGSSSGGGKSSGGSSGGSSGSTGGSSSSGRTSSSGGTTSRGPISIPGTSSRSSPFSNGGGSVARIPSGSTFAGRDIGGGSRGQIYGNRNYGSGYTYAGGNSYVGGRGFPFGYWPLFWGGGYYGASEYSREHNADRPGGDQYYAALQSRFWPGVSNATQRAISDSNSANNGTSANGTTVQSWPAPLALVGDMNSLQDALDVLMSSNCSPANTTIIPLAENSTNFGDGHPRPENVVQYYRSSSFALALTGYNNTAALASNVPSNDSQTNGIPDTPIPANLTDLTFLGCVNQTIGDSLPILDATSSASSSVHLLIREPIMASYVSLAWLIVILFKNLL